MKFCGGCGAPQVAGDQFCVRCGRAYSAEEPAAAAADETPGVQPSSAQPPPRAQWANTDDEPFPEWAPIAAGAAVVFVPFISLIAALLMRSSEVRPSRRSFLKNWAIASGAWLCTGFILVILVISAVAGSGGLSGGCKGGPDPFGIPTYVQQSGSRQWTAIVPCVGGGTKTRPARPGEVP